MEGIKYVNLIEIGPVVIEIRGAENGELAVPVNNTLVSHTAFLAVDTRPCVLINNTLVSHTAFLAADTRPCVLIPMDQLLFYCMSPYLCLYSILLIAISHAVMRILQNVQLVT